MNNRILYLLIFGFTAGIFVSSFLDLGFYFFTFLLLLAGSIFVFGQFKAKEKILILSIALFIFSFSLGVLRYEIKDKQTKYVNLENSLGQKVNIKGIILDEPSIKDQGVQLIVKEDSGAKILISAGLFPEFRYGDLISVTGKLEKPENFQTDNGKEFDYIGFLAKEDIFYKIDFAQTQIISSGNGSFLKEKLFAFKNNFISRINLLIKEPESSLLGGLLLGAKNSLGKELQADFRTAGVSHIVALSGYNITIIAVGIMFLFSSLPKAFSLSFGVVGILLFAIMTGGSATVIRASIMALLVLLAKSTNRKYDVNRALFLAGTFMLIQNPKILVFDLSFQLSFLATIAIIFISPIFEKKFSNINWLKNKYLEKIKFKEILSSTIATQIFVLPFLLYKIGLLSIFSLPANILILPVIPAVMLFGFLAGSLAFISGLLAWPLALVCSLLLSYMLKIIYIFSHLPLASLALEFFPVSLMILVYIIYFVLFYYFNFKMKR